MDTSVRSEGEKIPSAPPPPERGHLPGQIPPLEEIFLAYCPAQPPRKSLPKSHRESPAVPVATSDTSGADTPLDTPGTPLSESSLPNHLQTLPLEDLDAAISNLGQIAGNLTGFDNHNTEDESIASEEARETTSPVPSDFILVLENGRQYPQYGQFQYGLPVDGCEQERLEIQHTKYLELLKGQLFLAPIYATPQRILDLGTGRGLWAIDVADMYPVATVTAIDLAAIQPKLVPPNCHFQIGDIEDPWRFREKTFDFIYARDLVQSIRNWPKLVDQAYRSLKPGGWLELACECLWPYCDDSSLPLNSAFEQTCELLIRASEEFGTPTSASYSYVNYLRQKGFVKVIQRVYKIPLGPWPRETTGKNVGMCQRLNLSQGATAFGLRIFRTVFGWSEERTKMQMAYFMNDVRNEAFHTYSHYVVVYGQRADDSSSAVPGNQHT